MHKGANPNYASCDLIIGFADRYSNSLIKARSAGKEWERQTFKSIISLSFFSISTFNASSADGVAAAFSSFLTSGSDEYHLALAPHALGRVAATNVGRDLNRRDCARDATDGEERSEARDWRRRVREIMVVCVMGFEEVVRMETVSVGELN